VKSAESLHLQLFVCNFIRSRICVTDSTLRTLRNGPTYKISKWSCFIAVHITAML